jgi:hypothetical protein
VRLRKGRTLVDHPVPLQKGLGGAPSQRSLGCSSHGPRTEGASKDPFPDHQTNQESMACVMVELNKLRPEEERCSFLSGD